jgi:cellulose synthase/poly-beta-1,6-N-acetylglucosamine synthase-like glycosyltransferase
MKQFEEITIDQLQLGDNLLLDNKDLLGELIQLFERSRVNHASMYSGHGTVYEAILPKYIETPILKSLDKTRNVYVQRPLYKFDPEIVTKTAQSLIGINYDIKEIIFQLDKEIEGGWKGDKDPHKLICSKANQWINKCSCLDSSIIWDTWYKDSPANIFENRIYFQCFKLKF